MEQPKEYYAFISYKREDEKWAKWLADELEHYHLPATLNGKELPKNLRPIFKDSDELSAGNLSKQIYQALSVSKNLIVVCSPRSAKSGWVEKEIKYFINIKGGKADNIYPFIIEGTPFSKDSNQECFPDTLRNLSGSEERLGGNINEQGGRNAAVVKIIAGMLGIGFDSLWQKYEREKKRKRNIKFATIFSVLSLFAIGAFAFAKIVSDKNTQLEKASLRIQENFERIQKDSQLLATQNDRLILQNSLIQSQRDSLDRSSKKLKLSNIHLIEERNKVLRANWKMQENISRRITNEINKAINNGDIYLAQRLIKEILPFNIDSPEKPFLHETEDAIRAINSVFLDSVYKSVAILGKGDYSFFMGENKLVINEINHTTAFVYYKENFEKTPLAVPLGMNNGKDYCKIWNLNEGTSNKREGAFWAWNNGHYLAAISNNEYELFVIDTLTATDYVKLPVSFSQQYLATCKPHTLSRNGKFVAYEIGDSIFVFNLLERKLEISINARQPICDISISPHENRILFVADSILYEYDLKSHKKTLNLPNYMAAEYNFDGSMVYAAKKKDTIDIVSCNRGRIENQLHLTYDNCSKIVLSPDERLLAIICGKDIVLWDLKNSTMTQSIKGYGEIKNFSFSPKMDCFVTTDNNNDVRLWSNKIINPWGFNLLKAEKDYYFDNLWLSPLKDYFVLNTVPITQNSDSLELIIFDLNEFSVKKKVKLPSVTLPQIGKMDYRYSLYNNLFVFAITSNRSSSLVGIIDLERGETIKVIEYPNSINSVSFSPDGKELVITESKRAYYSTSSWNLIYVDSISRGNIAIRKRPNEQNYITCQNRNVEIKKNFKVLEAIIKSNPMISDFGFSNNQIFFAAQEPFLDIIKVYNLSTGKSKEYNGVKGAGKMWFNDENTKIYIENFKGLYVLDLESGRISMLSSVAKPFVMGFNYYLYNDRDVVSIRAIPTIKEIISSWEKKISNYPLTNEEKRLYYLE